MKYLVGNRSSGKTKKLLEYAKENNLSVICLNPDAMRVKAESYGIVGLNFLPLYHKIDRHNGTRYVIDNLEDYLNYHNIDNFTLTVD